MKHFFLNFWCKKNKLSINFLIFVPLFLFSNCGTIYTPQILPEGRGVARTEGQEIVNLKIIPLTLKEIKRANEDDYKRRVLDAGNLNQAARLISIDQAINEKIPLDNDPGQYEIGIGDVLVISQILNSNDNESFSSKVTQRTIRIADDGFSSILGIGRVPLAGLTQFKAEDMIYKRFILEQINPEFELNISEFKSKNIQVTNNLLNKGESSSNIFVIPYTNLPLYLNNILSKSKVILGEGEDAQVVIKRKDNEYRLSLRSVIERHYKKIRLFPDDQVIINPIKYRPETVVITGEVINTRLYSLSPSDRKTLSEALYDEKTLDLVTSDTSQIYLLRPKDRNNIRGYHLDASNPSRLLLANKIELRPGDIIFVAPQPVTNYNRAFRQIFGAYAMTINPLWAQ